MVGVPPEVRDGIPTVSPTRQYLQPPRALSIGTRFPLLFLAGLVADGGPEVHLVTVGKSTPHGAHQHAQAGLLEDVDVVVVGVPHRPARGVPLGFLAGRRVHKPAVPVCPFFPPVVLAHPGDARVVDVPIGPSRTPAFSSAPANNTILYIPSQLSLINYRL